MRTPVVVKRHFIEEKILFYPPPPRLIIRDLRTTAIGFYSLFFFSSVPNRYFNETLQSHTEGERERETLHVFLLFVFSGPSVVVSYTESLATTKRLRVLDLSPASYVHTTQCLTRPLAGGRAKI